MSHVFAWLFILVGMVATFLSSIVVGEEEKYFEVLEGLEQLSSA